MKKLSFFVLLIFLLLSSVSFGQSMLEQQALIAKRGEWDFANPTTMKRILSEEFIGCDCQNEIYEIQEEIFCTKLQYKDLENGGGELRDLSGVGGLLGTCPQLYYNGKPFTGRLIPQYDIYDSQGKLSDYVRISFKNGWADGPAYKKSDQGVYYYVCNNSSYNKCFGISIDYLAFGPCSIWKHDLDGQFKLLFEENQVCSRSYHQNGQLSTITIFVPEHISGEGLPENTVTRDYELEEYDDQGNLLKRNEYKFIVDPRNPFAYKISSKRLNLMNIWNEVYKSDYNISGIDVDSIFRHGKLDEVIRRNSDEKEHGKQEKYHNGKFRSNSNYRNGKKDGEQILYFKDGRIQTKEYYTDGLASGVWEEYYENGKLKSKGEQCGGESHVCKTGVWEEYYENGSIKSKITYFNGEQRGPFELYWENGNIMQKGDF